MNRTEAIEKLKSGIKSIVDSAMFREFLNVKAKFWKYSMRNAFLIMFQNPKATQVAGYRTWQSLGRQVRAGEKGIGILAPIVYHKKIDDGSTSDETMLGFRVVHVFDVSQTEGKELPAGPTPKILDGSGLADVFQNVKALIESKGFTVSIGDIEGEAFGVTDYTKKTVVVRTGLPELQTLKTLTHEAGHVLLHGPDVRPDGFTRDEAETEAESVAYLTLAHFNLDAGEYSFPYLVGWGTDEKRLMKALKRIQSGTDTILSACKAEIPAELAAA